jgi:glycerol-3-phosphate dehydrogenase subunit C
MCAVECPSHVNIPKLMMEAKAKYRRAHRGSVTDAVLGHAEAASALGRRAAPLADRLLRWSLTRWLAEQLMGIDRRRRMPAFARQTLPQLLRAQGVAAAVSGRQSSKVASSTLAAYFHDLFVGYNEPQLGADVVRLLLAHGIEVVLPEQRSSGIPEMLYGYAAAARKTVAFDVREMRPWVERGAAVLSAEPTASFAFKVHYPDFLATPECSAVAGATHDLGEFLVRFRSDHPGSAPSAGKLGGPWAAVKRVAYHQPCHLKAQQVGSPALELLREIPGLEVIDLASGCCGMAGTFGMKRETYELSMQTGAPLFERIAAVAPDLVVTECSTCRMQIAEATGLETVHPVSLLLSAYSV